jgi:hypothetical protein
MFSREKRGFEDDSRDSQDDSPGSEAAHKTMISAGAAPASMHVHGRAGKPKQLAQYAKNPGETRVFERRGQDSNN